MSVAAVFLRSVFKFIRVAAVGICAVVSAAVRAVFAVGAARVIL